MIEKKKGQVTSLPEILKGFVSEIDALNFSEFCDWPDGVLEDLRQVKELCDNLIFEVEEGEEL